MLKLRIPLKTRERAQITPLFWGEDYYVREEVFLWEDFFSEIGEKKVNSLIEVRERFQFSFFFIIWGWINKTLQKNLNLRRVSSRRAFPKEEYSLYVKKRGRNNFFFLLTPSKKLIFFSSLGLFKRYYGGKAKKFSKATFVIQTSFVFQFLKLLKLKPLTLFVWNGIPLLETLWKVQVQVAPSRNLFSSFIYNTSYTFSKLKRKKMGRIKRKIRRKLVKKNSFTDY